MKTASAPNTIAADFTERKSCRACDSKTLMQVLPLGNQTLPRFTDTNVEVIPAAPLNLVQCGTCGLLQLAHTVNPDSLFREYWYRSSINQSMRDALKDVVAGALEFVDSGCWLDIGANDGYLLSQVPNDFAKVACEPALTFKDELDGEADLVIPDYFTKGNFVRTSAAKPTVITSCAMFYDLEDPTRFVSDIAEVLDRDGVWINQLNDAPTMMEANAFDSICHEHLTYWGLGQLHDLYRKCGMKIVKIERNDVNGGSVRVYAVHSKRPIKEAHESLFTNVTRGTALRFADRVHNWKTATSEILRAEVNRRGPVWGYGASTKAGTLLQFLDEPYCFHAVADRNPLKHGKYMATRLKIVSEDELRARAPKMVVPFIWAFRKEILERERDIRDMGTTMFFVLPNPELVL